MKNFLLSLLDKDEKLLKHSALVLSATMIGMIISYFYQLILGRLLGPAEYGIFGSLIAIVYIISVFSGTINTSITKFSSEFAARKEYGKLKTLLVGYSTKLTLIGLLLFLVFSLFSTLIAGALGISSLLSIIIIGLLIPFSLLYAVITGLLRGLQMFTKYSLVSVVQPIAKFAIGIAFVFLGFGVLGAISGVVFSGIIVCIFSFTFLKFLLKEKAERVDKAEIVRYSFPVLVVSLCITLITNIDIILVKYYFFAIDAGLYVAASTLTKVIFWVAGSLITVMFPKVSEMKEKEIETKKMLTSTMLYIFVFSLLVMLPLLIAPDFITTIIFGHAFAEASKIMLPFAVAILLMSLNNIIVSYNLALKDTRGIYSLIGATILEALLIIMFHDSLMTVVEILILSNLALFLALIISNKM